MKLKDYQSRALTALEGFFQATRTDGIATAWEFNLKQQGRPLNAYDKTAFGETPCVCLRLPTGGGKTILGAHAVARVGKNFCDTDAPIALWLVPSDTIRTQTLEALSNPRHPYRAALESYFPGNVRVCAIEDLGTVAIDAGRKAIIIVATIQTFRITDTTLRNVYAADENIYRFFQNLPGELAGGMELVSEKDLENQPFLKSADLGKPKASITNWLYMQRPIVIVDEAHNSRTHNSFTTLKRLNPACIIELTATPIPGSNVLYHVSALQLKTEHMIKLPIVLSEHPTGWQNAVRDALLTRKQLEILAQGENEYIRPITLFQAESKDRVVTVEVLKQYLIEEEGLQENQIAVATGAQKDLDGVNLFDPACPIRCVITVEALKEGWDCSFAYVLCSLQESRSAKDVEQLLGRVLRMPYAKERKEPKLNQAYAHIIAESFASAASQLTDRMVANMGFDPFEAAIAFTQPTEPDLFGDNGSGTVQKPQAPEAIINLVEMPTVQFSAEVAAVVEVRPTSQGATVIVRGELTEAVEFALIGSQAKKYQAKVAEQITQQRMIQQSLLAPSVLGVPFAPLPQLCLWDDDELLLVGNETLAELGGMNLLGQQIQLPNFSIRESAHTFEIDIDGKKLTYSMLDARQLELDNVSSNATTQDLTRWLDRECRQADIPQSSLLKYLTLMVRHLMAERGFTLTALLRAKHQLAEAIRNEMSRLRSLAIRDGFQKSLPNMQVASLEGSFKHEFTFKPDQYPARNIYTGRFKFKKHYYPAIHDLRERRLDGKFSEEFVCAQTIEKNPHVKHWVRNIEREPRFSFWLPTATDYFYPDFVVELTNGKILVIEYKGEPYKTNDDSREKNQVGSQWQSTSNGECSFLFAVLVDDLGKGVEKQIDDAIQSLI
ncbi:DEAD/DEAH box helicase [Pseudomonas syringae]|uniref:DEAD/DEAH box helicase n=1 Tax=Pseudomonas syringae TaxID=317 RepID=UPI000B2F2701|nr:DEAD/DEAH box helicase family protein [Pseudomonas syringae]